MSATTDFGTLPGCPDCGIRLSVDETLHVRGNTYRKLRCKCGSRFETEETIVRRLPPVTIRARRSVPVGTNEHPPIPVDTGPPSSGGGIGGGLPAIPDGTPDSNPISPGNPKRARARSSHKAETPAFKAFYAAYPRKEKRPAALRAWLAQECEPIAETVMLALAKWQPEFARRKAKDPSTVPHPASWLNGWQWEDEPPTVVTPIHSAVPPWKQAERDEEARKRDERNREAAARERLQREQQDALKKAEFA